MPDGAQTGDKKDGFWVVISGLIVLAGVFFFAAWRWPDVKDVTAAVGAVSGTVGTLVGAYFGVQTGAAGRDKAEADRDKAQARLTQLLAACPPDLATGILAKMGD